MGIRLDRLRTCLIVAALGWMPSVPSAAEAHHLMRLADVHADEIVFTYEGDLWLVPSTGGLARRLTRDGGLESGAKFSPDGSTIAFTAQYDGGEDVYVMDARGGAPTRLSYHPARDRVTGWWPDGKSIVFRSNRAWPHRGEEVYRISLDGGLPTRLPIDRAGLNAISPDGKSIAYNRGSREGATWKRHRGGNAQDIWLGDLAEKEFRKIIDSDWSDNFPMWRGEAIFFSSDREDGTHNLYRLELGTEKITRLTHYTDYDVKYPSIGPNQIVYQYAESLHVLDLDTAEARLVPVEIPSDLVRMRSEFVSVAPRRGSFGLSPSGIRMLLEARGEILNLPVKDGEPINLTRSPGSREKHAVWSPDGRWIAFVSDRTGEEEVYLVDQEGAGDWRPLTTKGLGFRMPLVWAPDSSHLLFSDKFMRLNMLDVASGEIVVIDKADYDDAWERWGIQDYVWSPCGRWVAYTKMEQSLYESIFLYSLDDGSSHRLTGDLTQDWSPSFSHDGKVLYFLSNRTFTPVMCFVDQNHVFGDMARPYVMLLQADAESPFALEDSAEGVEEDEEDEEAEGAAEEGKPTRIDLDGIRRRIVVAEGVSAGNYFRLEATEKGLMLLHRPKPQFLKYQAVTDQTGGRLDLVHYDLEEREATTVLSGIANYHQSADGKRLVYRSGAAYGVVKVGEKAKDGDGRIDLGDVKLEVDRVSEFAQAFDEAWRIQRDWFYDPNLHGLDWEATREKYRRFLPYCGNRSDLNYLIGEMIAELNIGHTYVGGGDVHDGAKRVATGLLGAEFETTSGHYRLTHVVPNVPGDPSERSPLDEPGCPIDPGDYVLAIDGESLTASDNIYALLQNKRSRVITVSYNDRPTPEGAQTCRVKTIGSERGIRYREWVEGNRAKVEQATAGRVGYVHIPNMGASGLVEFARAFYPHYYKEGFIIDVRYNGGGFTADMIIDRLERRLWGLTQPREGKVLRDPERVFAGPWTVLINEDTGSNGEMFAEAIQIKEMARVIGMRTWGGSIGIEAHQDLVDGGTVTPPQFGLYTLDGRWPIEGRGVEPDLEVQNMPADVLAGRDAQLQAGIAEVLGSLEKNPVQLPPAPPYPIKRRPRGS